MPERVSNMTDLDGMKARLAAAERRRDELEAALAIAKRRERARLFDCEHRIRNMLGVIRSIYRRMREGGASQDEFAEHFIDRLDVIARYQGDLANEHSRGVELEDVVWNELLRLHLPAELETVVDGPAIRLRRQTLELLALAIHELTTNSIKFGALSRSGKLAVTWTVSAQALGLHWAETTVPVVAAAPRQRGFGQQLIEEALPFQLGATTTFALKPGGFDCRIDLPLPTADAARNFDTEPSTSIDME